MISQAVVICATMSKAVTITIRWDPMMIESRWWCFLVAAWSLGVERHASYAFSPK
jgi:hypothetical protein